MAALRYFSRHLLRQKCTFDANTSITSEICNRFLSYTPKEYSDEKDPTPIFFNNEIQKFLKTLTRADTEKVFRRRKLGANKLQIPIQKFMTEDQLQEEFKAANAKAKNLLQMPPVLKVRKIIDKVISSDVALKDYGNSPIVFTDITFGIKNSDRFVVVREPNGTLRHAEWDIRDRMIQLYFPFSGRKLRTPTMFQDEYFESLLNRKEFVFILDSTCAQFEPNSLEYQKFTSITYQCINDDNEFECVRSTRHFGPMVFFLTWHKIIDNLLLELIETQNIIEANTLIQLYTKLHNVPINVEDLEDTVSIEEYIKSYSQKKASLELAVQAYKDMEKERKQLEQGIKHAHGLV